MARRLNYRPRKIGVTTTELLIVIAIISTMGTVLAPFFSEANEKDREAVCASNLKSLGVAFAQYERDNDGYVPCGGGNYAQGMGWAGQIYPYVKSAKVFLCPDDNGSDASGDPDVISYGMNSNYVWYNGSATTPATSPEPASISKFTAPAKTVELFEVTNCAAPGASIPTTDNGANGWSPVGAGMSFQDRLSGWNGGYYTKPTPNTNTSTTMKYATGLLGAVGVSITKEYDTNTADITPGDSLFTGLTGRHSNGSNFLLADGHVKCLLPQTVGGGSEAGAGSQPGVCPPAYEYNPPSVDCALSESGQPFTWSATFSLN